MDEQFHKSQALSPGNLAMLLRRSDSPAWWRFMLLCVLWAGAVLGAVWTWGQTWWLWGCCLILLALLCCSTFACEHETVHGTAFRSPWLNRLAAFVAGLLHVYPSVLFGELHFTHHRYTHIPGKDPEISLGGRPGPSVVRRLWLYLAWLSGMPLLSFKIMMTLAGALGMPEFWRRAMFPFVRPAVRWRLMLESWLVLGVNAGFVFLALWVQEGFWTWWLGQVLGHGFLAFYVTPEHNGLPFEPDNILEKTRSMRAWPLVKWWMWNMPYHAEHHAYPGVPFHALPRLHQALQDELKHKDLTYPGFHAQALSGKWR